MSEQQAAQLKEAEYKRAVGRPLFFCCLFELGVCRMEN